MNLVEIMIATTLGMAVMIGGLDILAFGARHQIDTVRQMRLQGDASLAWRTMETALRQSTVVLTPANEATTTDILMGCENYDRRSGVLNPSLPVTAFMFCESAGKLYYHRVSPSTCPMIDPPSCAATGAIIVADHVSHRPGTDFYFSRPSKGLVRFVFETSSAGASQSMDVTVAYNAAAGTNQ